ncbi:insulinase family protein [Mucilaginibacter sp. L196]|uniref:insulinase family protein n=1 Tax=Mucilaginibacter sp. L196 TaxID=1641870 RepID=UPI00131D441C|nr:insulinase family protein [Mucilaginibacter sp. L196]
MLGTKKYPKQWYSFEIQFGCAPQNVDKLIASALDEVSKLRNDGPPQENIDKWRAEDKVTMQTELNTNIFWLKYLNAQLENQEPITQLNDRDRLFQQLRQIT